MYFAFGRQKSYFKFFFKFLFIITQGKTGRFEDIFKKSMVSRNTDKV